MAVHKAAIVYSGQAGSQRVQTYTWGVPTTVAAPGDGLGNQPRPAVTFPAATYTALASGDTCTAEYMPGLTDKTVQVTGTTGSGGTITIEGCNDGTNFVTLHDVFGNSLAAIVPGTVYQINEAAAWVNVVVNSGDGTTALNVILAGKKPF